MKKEYFLEIIFAVLSILLLCYMIFTWNHIGKDKEIASEEKIYSEGKMYETIEVIPVDPF